MTTQTDQSTPANPAAYLVSVWDVVPCLLWAALGLAVQAWWLSARDLEAGAPIYLGTAAVAIGYLALFLIAALKRFKATDKVDRGDELRPVMALAGLVGGGLLVLLSVWACVKEKEKLPIFAEVSSLAVMGLICLGGGLSLRLTGQSALSREALLQRLLSIRAQLGIGLVAVGLAVAALGVYYVFKAGRTEFSIRFPGGPEGIGLTLIGLVLLAGGIWTQLTLDRPATVDTMRKLVLFVGSMTGLIIALLTMVRFVPWWNRYLTGGPNTWQGAESWRFWLCAYVELTGLLLLFGSLLLGRVDIRANVGMRRLLYGYNAFLTGFLLLVLLVVLNIAVAVRFPSNIHWTQSLGMHSLSDTAASTLEGLKQKVTVYVLLSRGSEYYQDVHDLLDNCQGVTNMLDVEYVSPDLDPARYRTLSAKFPELDRRRMNPAGSNGLLVVYGDGPVDKTLPSQMISERDLGTSETDPRQAKTRAFNGEQVLIQTVQTLAEDKIKPKIYFTQLSGELWLNDRDVQFDLDPFPPRQPVDLELGGAGAVAAKLRKDNYEVVGLIWGNAKPGMVKLLEPVDVVNARKAPTEKPEIPDDCKVLVIANPYSAFPKDAQEALDRYMDRGGKLMVLTKTGFLPNNKFTEDGMIDLCKKLGVELSNNFVLKSANDVVGVLETRVKVPQESTNKVANRFRKTTLTFIMPRTVQPIKGPGPYQADVILQVSDVDNGGEIWASTGPTTTLFQSAVRFVDNLRKTSEENPLKEPRPSTLPVGVALSDREGRPRAIVIGDYSFIATQTMPWPQQGQASNYDFFRSCLEWLSERQVPVLGIRPKETSYYRLSSADVNGWRLFILPFSLSVLVLAGMGTGIWIVRRK